LNRQTFFLQADFSGIINCNTFLVVPSVINENVRFYADENAQPTQCPTKKCLPQQCLPQRSQKLNSARAIVFFCLNT
jgi:hypothetical protein